jgi:hypothetical protein
MVLILLPFASGMLLTVYLCQRHHWNYGFFEPVEFALLSISVLVVVVDLRPYTETLSVIASASEAAALSRCVSGAVPSDREWSARPTYDR